MAGKYFQQMGKDHAFNDRHDEEGYTRYTHLIKVHF